jgi:hypothetical protein
VAYLRCPACRLTAPAAAYYLRGDQCPRCLTQMEPAEHFREPKVTAAKEPQQVTAQSSAA